ncbi:MAG: hypothetical protein AAF602_05630 [Myxococcota bacterium]
MLRTFALGAGLALFSLPSDAFAFGGFRNNIPNGFVTPPGATASCQNCHVNPNGGAPWNDFGNQIRSLGAPPVWANLVDLDADNDGQTNGEELGDPCGDWTPGAMPPRTTDLSAPGDASFTSADPNTPLCDQPTTGDTGAPPGPTGDTGEPPLDTADTGTAPTNPTGPTGDTGDGEEPTMCGCATPASPGQAVLLLPLVALAWRRREA